MSAIRLFYVIGTLDVGGAEGQLYRLVKGLDRQRFDVTVCCLSSAAGPYADEIRRLGIKVYEIGFRGLRIFRQPHKVAAQLLRLGWLIRRHRPHIVHGYLFWAYVLGTLAARAVGVATVISSRRSLGNFKAGKRFYRMLERMSNPLTSLVIANSSAVRDDTITREQLPLSKVVVIYNGVELDEVAPRESMALREELRLEGRSPVVTVVANFIKYKGHGFFFEGWKDVVAAHQSAVAILVGDGPERSKWERWVRDEGLEGSVRFVGQRRDVAAIFGVTDLVAHPSLEEGFSNAVLEAMAAGRPIVATAVGGTPEAVKHEVTGLLVPPRDARALADAIMRLASHRVLAHQMGDAARELVRRCFSVDRMVRSHEELYSAILSGVPPRVSDPVGCAGTQARQPTKMQ